MFFCCVFLHNCVVDLGGFSYFYCAIQSFFAFIFYDNKLFKFWLLLINFNIFVIISFLSWFWFALRFNFGREESSSKII